ncbi:MAG: 4Fe-4S binding protein [Verrucomicrobiae bacterium]|nr:4Fe-4S binding protein [Verrucomicrobiae bacterium]
MKKPGKMLMEVLRHAPKKPATEMYPHVRPYVPERFRGRLDFIPGKCIGCKMCMRDCPSKAITINKIGDKKFEAVIDLDRCIYCGQCVDSCPKDALLMTTDFELAQLDRRKLKIVLKDAGNATDAKPEAEPEKPVA